MRHFSILILLVLMGTCNWALGQTKDSDKGQFSGNLLLTYQKYVRDDSIGANTKVYKENTASADAWLFMQYRIKGYSFVLRYDAFNNSPLLDPQSAYTNHGIGFWQINKNIDKLDITMGSFYDQFGTGILFRAYEQRQIGIDYAIQGMRLKYNLNDKWAIKGFAGNQKGNIKNRFGFANQVISGLNIEGNLGLGADSKYGDLQVGASVVNRTLDRETMDRLVSTINTYELADRFYPKYNVYGGNAYLTYTKDNFSWTVEGNVKSKEAIMEDDSKFQIGRAHV